MMTALATVTRVEPKKHGFYIDLSCEQKSSCSHCSSQKSCGTGLVSKAVGKKSLHWQMNTQKSLKVGQVVEIGFPEGSLIKSALIVYLIPLIALIVGALLANAILVPLTGGEGVVILSAAVFAAFGVWLARIFSRPLEQESGNQVELIRVLGEPIA